jgi:catechol 2,3-dioxygenase-like lactoylglutathione lyase family enzyme
MPAEYDGLAVHGVEPGLRVKDIEAALSFWRDLVGFEPYAEIFAPGGVHVYALRYGDSMIKLMHVDEARADASGRYGTPLASAQRPAAFASHYLTVHVLNALDLQKECEAAGVEVVMPYSPFVPDRPGDPGCGVVVVLDPDGNTVEFSEGSPWVAATEGFRRIGGKGRP